MSLRNAYAATIQWLRLRKGLSQKDLQGQAADQAHISRLEAAKVSATFDLTFDLAQALKVSPLSLMAMIAAADEGKTARILLRETMAELEDLGVLDDPLPCEPQKLEAPQSVAAAKKHKVIQEMKQAGFSQAETARQLGLPKTTVRRHW